MKSPTSTSVILLSSPATSHQVDCHRTSMAPAVHAERGRIEGELNAVRFDWCLEAVQAERVNPLPGAQTPGAGQLRLVRSIRIERDTDAGLWSVTNSGTATVARPSTSSKSSPLTFATAKSIRASRALRTASPVISAPPTWPRIGATRRPSAPATANPSMSSMREVICSGPRSASSKTRTTPSLRLTRSIIKPAPLSPPGAGTTVGNRHRPRSHTILTASPSRTTSRIT